MWITYLYIFGYMGYYYILRACVCTCVSFYGGKSSAQNFLKLFLDIKKSLCRLQSNKITYSVPSSEGLGTNKKKQVKKHIMNYQYQYITNHQDDKDFAPIIKWDRKRLNVDLLMQMECYYIRDKNVFLDIFDTLLKDTESGKVRHWFYEGDENYIVQWAFEHYAKEFLGLKEWEFNQLKLEMWEIDEDAERWVSRATHNQEVKRRLKGVKIYYPSYPETYADYYELRIKRTHNTTKPSWAVWKSNGWGAEGECLVKGLTPQEAIDFRDNYKVEK